MASRRSRTRRDKRSEATEYLGLDEDQPEDAENDILIIANGERIDLRAPWDFPTTTDERTGQ